MVVLVVAEALPAQQMVDWEIHHLQAQVKETMAAVVQTTQAHITEAVVAVEQTLLEEMVLVLLVEMVGQEQHQILLLAERL
jgi:hypothetical protein